ncbi:hypothetical protein SAMN02910298_02192 [Pseudobutyrivibrio sp. YE44]|uniref:hypothetical protein n=1 Tax=Pseudobutyrivibrio sp. YE44 TaxID=1520802 RepID=UPI00087FD49C|nr:hypothetical protein [Pseudobutyrivibrio sp. YE44]SDB43773.1 hypothetical protein SAMN02910298_02192 [Pseudobutyrivibrio sp. YE44]
MITSSSGKYKYNVHFIYRCSYCNALIITQNRLDIGVNFDCDSNENEKRNAADICVRKAVDSIVDKTYRPEAITDLFEKNNLAFDFFNGDYSLFGLDCSCPSCNNKNVWQKGALRELIEVLEPVELPRLIDGENATKFYQAENLSFSDPEKYVTDLKSTIDSRYKKYRLLLEKFIVEKANLLSQVTTLETSLKSAAFFSKHKIKRQIKELNDRIKHNELLVSHAEQELKIYNQVKSTFPFGSANDCNVDYRVIGKMTKDKYEDSCGGIIAVTYGTIPHDNCDSKVVRKVLSA